MPPEDVVITDEADKLRQVRAELLAGLTAQAAFISPKYLYDELGSRLFDAICLLPEYYLTRKENEIFATHMAEISACLGRDVCLIEPGAGNCSKAARMFASLQPKQFVAIDISAQYLHAALQPLRMAYSEVEIIGLGMDMAEQLDLPPEVLRKRRVFFYPGSSIGNYTPEQALQWLGRLRAACDSDGGLLIGVDLVKEKAILDAAYDDALGVTAAFNLNLLNHTAQILQADFKLADWQHKAFFNTQQSRIEMHLQARHAVQVNWPDGGRHFAAGETIHTENSYKYTVGDFSALLRDAGFAPQQVWQDKDRWFALFYARAV
ncbi:MAG: L-histidine N(alpha)-methyltransferase [Burkholderiales bacterium]|nr:L-histidine N(alpha)-methyltransferase [Burkholderiales bacterium]